MSERKVLNKYYPADYDPSKIPKGKRNRNATFNIRIMAPFNMRCNMCKEYIYKGKKFNSRKEDVMDEDYLGLRIFRFYIKCPRCVSEIAFKTDLANTDYTLEAGAKRLFEAEKIAQQMAEEERKAKEEDEMNPMKMLENRTKASRAEMDQIDTLEELREMNTRKNQVNTDAMIEKYRKYEELLAQLQMEQEEEEIKEIFGGKGERIVKRLEDSDSDSEEPPKKKLAATLTSTSKPTDILAEESKPSAAQKVPESWQKSVGGLSSKQKLKGLVVKKKTSVPLGTFTSTKGASLDSSEKPDPSGCVNGVPPADSVNGVASSDVVGNHLSSTIDGNSSSGGLPVDSSSSENKLNERLLAENDGGDEETAGNELNIQSANNSDETSDNGNSASTSKSSVEQNQMSSGIPAGSKTSALGLLGTYSDSDSESGSN